jgi:hypothetical protein
VSILPLRKTKKDRKTAVNVVIKIFCDFCQFSAKNWRFSQKPMLQSKRSSSLSKKRYYFCQIFR